MWQLDAEALKVFNSLSSSSPINYRCTLNGEKQPIWLASLGISKLMVGTIRRI